MLGIKNFNRGRISTVCPAPQGRRKGTTTSKLVVVRWERGSKKERERLEGRKWTAAAEIRNHFGAALNASAKKTEGPQITRSVTPLRHSQLDESPAGKSRSEAAAAS